MIHVRIRSRRPGMLSMLETILQTEADMLVSGDVAREADGEPPDVILADADAMATLDRDPEESIPIILVTDRETAPLATRDREVISGLLPSDAPHDVIIAAVRAVAAGFTVFPATTQGSPQVPTFGDSPEELTPRETEVLGKIAAGYSNRDIAGILGISDHTVKFHVASILGKLGASSRTEAVTSAIRRGILMV